MSAGTGGHGAYSKKICKKNAEADRKVIYINKIK